MHVDELDLDFECDQSWSELQTDESPVGHCDKCDKTVVNLSMLTEEQARELLQSGAPPCALALYHTSSGRIAFADSEQLSAQRTGLSRLVAAGAASLILMSGLQTLADSPPSHQLAAQQMETALESPAQTVGAVSPLDDLFDLETKPKEPNSDPKTDPSPDSAVDTTDDFGRTVGY